MASSSSKSGVIVVPTARHALDARLYSGGKRINDFDQVQPDDLNPLRAKQIRELSSDTTLNTFHGIAEKINQLDSDDQAIARALLSHLTFRLLEIPAIDQTGQIVPIKEVYAIVSKEALNTNTGTLTEAAALEQGILSQANLLKALALFGKEPLNVDKFILPDELDLGLIWHRTCKAPMITGGHHLISFMTNGLISVEQCPPELVTILNRGDAKMMGCYNGKARERGIPEGEIFVSNMLEHTERGDVNLADHRTGLVKNHLQSRAPRFMGLANPPETKTLSVSPLAIDTLEKALDTLPSGTPMAVEKLIREEGRLGFVQSHQPDAINNLPTIIVKQKYNDRGDGNTAQEVFHQLTRRLPQGIELRMETSDDFCSDLASDNSIPSQPGGMLRIANAT